MGHWSLFTAYAFSYMISLWLLSTVSTAYDKLPAHWKSEDKDGDGVPDEEAEILKNASLDPISKVIVERRELKEKIAKAKEEAAEDIVKTLLGDE
jgi:hypothetical protein